MEVAYIHQIGVHSVVPSEEPRFCVWLCCRCQTWCTNLISGKLFFKGAGLFLSIISKHNMISFHSSAYDLLPLLLSLLVLQCDITYIESFLQMVVLVWMGGWNTSVNREFGCLRCCIPTKTSRDVVPPWEGARGGSQKPQLCSPGWSHFITFSLSDTNSHIILHQMSQKTCSHMHTTCNRSQ